MNGLDKTNGDGRRRIARVERLVVKVGSAVIAGGGRPSPRVIADLAYEVSVLQHRGVQVVMVVSGAVAAGYETLGLPSPPIGVVERQAAASIGQPRLMALFARAFSRQRVGVAQLLMTAEDIENRRRFLSARHTLQRLLAGGVVPIINENDALSDDESKVGDNDHLAALVANLVSAQALILLSTAEGVYADGGRGPVISTVEPADRIEQHVGPARSETGVGGMAAKVSAARLASSGGVWTIIAGGREPQVLVRLMAGEPLGTLFVPAESRLTARKRWIALRTRSRGVIRVDAGARQAIIEGGASLLPSGVVGVQGEFAMGARVELQDADGRTFAVGLASYPADAIRRLQGRRRDEFKAVLGYEYVREIVSRDDMVIMNGAGSERLA